MQPLSTPGGQPLVSKRLLNYLQADSDEGTVVQHDEFDQLIATQGLRIARFAFFRDVDVFLLILSNRRIINRRLSAYPYLEAATDEQLTE